MLDAARENLRSYNKTIDAVTEFNTSAAKSLEFVLFYSSSPIKTVLQAIKPFFYLGRFNQVAK